MVPRDSLSKSLLISPIPGVHCGSLRIPASPWSVNWNRFLLQSTTACSISRGETCALKFRGFYSFLTSSPNLGEATDGHRIIPIEHPWASKAGRRRGRVSPVRNSGGTSRPPDSRMKWSKSGGFFRFLGILGVG